MRRLSRWIALIGIVLCPHDARADWRPNGNIVSPHTFAETGPRLLADGHGGAFVSLDQFFVGPALQRFAANGGPAPGWSETVLGVLGNTTFRGVSRPVTPLSDGAGGCYLAWIQTGEFCTHGCGFNEPGRVHVQRVTAGGAPAPGWPVEGIVVSERLANPANGLFVSGDDVGGVWIVWQGADFNAVHLSPLGARRTAAESTVHTDAGWHALLAVSPDRHGGVELFWGQGDAGRFPHGRILGQRLSPDGRTLWGVAGIPVSTGEYDLQSGRAAVLTARDGDAVLAWSGSQAGDADIFVTRISRRAERIWGRDRVVCGAAGAQRDVRLAEGAGSSILVAWRDARPEAGVFAQRLDGRARGLLRRDGVPVCPGPGDRATFVMCGDGAGGAFLAWTEREGEWSLFATRLDAHGRPAGGWPAEAVPVCHRTGAAYDDAQAVSLDLARTASETAMLCWQDFRIPPTVPSAGYAEASFVMQLGAAGPAARPVPFDAGSAGGAVAAAAPRAPGAVFGLRAVFPNPSAGDAHIRLYLADDAPATLEVFDVTGRLVSRRDVGGRAGEQIVPLSSRDRLPPGLYLLRLAQRPRTATARVVVTR